jgi:hypothetical protein
VRERDRLQRRRHRRRHLLVLPRHRSPAFLSSCFLFLGSDCGWGSARLGRGGARRSERRVDAWGVNLMVRIQLDVAENGASKKKNIFSSSFLQFDE